MDTPVRLTLKQRGGFLARGVLMRALGAGAYAGKIVAGINSSINQRFSGIESKCEEYATLYSNAGREYMRAVFSVRVEENNMQWSQEASERITGTSIAEKLIKEEKNKSLPRRYDG